MMPTNKALAQAASALEAQADRLAAQRAAVTHSISGSDYEAADAAIRELAAELRTMDLGDLALHDNDPLLARLAERYVEHRIDLSPTALGLLRAATLASVK